jgi:hypothetical protein
MEMSIYIALWHDKALLHFLLEEKERDMYLTGLKEMVRKGGYVIIVTFSLMGLRSAAVCV